MLRSLFTVLFGCSHTRTTFPITRSRRKPGVGESHGRTHVTCLDCGEELVYDWESMKIEGGTGLRGGWSRWLRLRAERRGTRQG
jgi:hypothetical protein